MLPRNPWEILKKIIQRIAGPEVIEQCLHWNARTGKDGRATEAVR